MVAAIDHYIRSDQDIIANMNMSKSVNHDVSVKEHPISHVHVAWVCQHEPGEDDTVGAPACNALLQETQSQTVASGQAG